MTSRYELTRCAVCGGVDTEEIAGPEEIRREAELLWAFHMRRLSPRTPPGRLVDRVAFSQPRPWRVVRCRACGLVYRNPAEHRDELRDSYSAATSPDPATLRALHEAQRQSWRAQTRRLSAVLGRRGMGIEVGSYVGAFLGAARDARWQFEGLDVNTEVNEFVRSLGFVAHDGDLASFHPARAYDAVAIWNTFDQLEDPRAAARAAACLLRPGGVLAIRVPNGECYARWRQRLERREPVRAAAIAVLAHNNLLTFPYRFGFTPASLGRLLDDVGLEVVRTVHDALVPTADEWTRPWARVEERIVKRGIRWARGWFEMYARVAR